MTAKDVGYVLIALIVLGVAGIGVRLAATEIQQPLLTGGSPLTAGLVDKVVIKDREHETVLEKRADGGWWVGAYPAVDIRIVDVFENAARIDGAELIASNPDNHIYMGVSPKNGALVQFWRDEQKLEEFWIGDRAYAPLEEEERPIFVWNYSARRCFIRPPEQDDVYAMYCPNPDIFLADPDRWGYPLLVRIPPEEVDTLAYSYPGEEFSLGINNSVWVLSSGEQEQPARLDTVQSVLAAIDFGLATSEYLSQREIDQLDFSRPDASVAIGTKPGSVSGPTLLLFIRKPPEEEGDQEAYYAKDASLSYAYLLDRQTAMGILKTREELLPVPTPTATP